MGEGGGVLIERSPGGRGAGLKIRSICVPVRVYLSVIVNDIQLHNAWKPSVIGKSLLAEIVIDLPKFSHDRYCRPADHGTISRMDLIKMHRA